MNQRRYAVYDVFTDEPLAGNPLAVVLDCDGLDAAAMQRIAREFNLSESVFILPPRDARHRALARIFTPDYEMPFAGHPTVGSAIALAEQGGDGAASDVFVLEEQIGPVRCAVTRGGGAAFAEFDLPRLPERQVLAAGKAALAAALGLEAGDIGFDNHEPDLWSAGVPYVTIPVAGVKELGKISFDNRAWMELAPPKGEGVVASAYAYARALAGEGTAFRTRMFVPGSPSYEDPATGSAAAAFAGAVLHFDRPTGGRHRLWIEQGVEMGRPSRLRLDLDIAGEALTAARIGGHAVKVAEGLLFA